jgi:hypothetical protein
VKSVRHPFTSQSLLSRIGLAAVALFLALPSMAATFDLKTDWSNSFNSNGVWTSISAVPEPSQAALLAAGLFTVLAVSRRPRTQIKLDDAAV